MSEVLVAGSLYLNSVNTPLDKRSRVATLADIAAVQCPALGSTFYCVQTGKHYIITGLKAKQMGALSTPNAQIDTYQQLSFADVTKFQVYATDAVISAGTSDSATGLVYAADVPAGMLHTFRLRSDTPQVSQDILIDWGDGVISNLHNGDFISVDDSEYAQNGELSYWVSHTYSTPGRYIVTIHGKSYWGIQTKSDNSSIISRIFAADLPIASCLKNLSNAAQYSPKLQKVLIPTGMDMFVNIHNASGMFQGCVNLLSATNFATKFQYTRYVQNIFNGCSNMTTCDFRLPQNCIKAVAYRSAYNGCAALVADIADLLPQRGFDGTSLNMRDCFRGCVSLTGTVPSSILWGDMRINWLQTTNTFTGCSAAIRQQVPTTWGGTGTEVQDPHPISRSQLGPIIASKLDEALTGLDIQTGGSTGVGNVLNGYSARIITYQQITANDVTTYVLYLADAEDQIDWTKFQIGQTIRISAPATTDQLIYAQIATVDSTNNKITLTQALDLQASATLGMEKKTVSGYTSAATGGFTSYRVTLSGASSDAQICAGRQCYTRAGTGAFTKNSISGIIDNYIFLASASAAGTNSIYFPPSNAILSVATQDSDAIAFAAGQRNTVVGRTASAHGAYNTTDGDGTTVLGMDNKALGSISVVAGTSNAVTGQSVFTFGTANTVADSMNIVLGDNNRVFRQGNRVLGDSNTAAAINTYTIGTNNTLKSYGGMSCGTRNQINGKHSVAVGYRHKVDAESAYVIGRYGVIPDAAQNKNGFFIWGGHATDNDLALSVRVFRKEQNPAYDGTKLHAGYSADDPNPMDDTGQRKYLSVAGYKTEYRGQLKPITQPIEISDSQTVVLDPTLYSRVMLTGSGTVTFGMQSYSQDGDKVELVFDSNNITPVFPAQWVTKGIDTTTTPGLYVLQVAKVASTIFYSVLYP